MAKRGKKILALFLVLMMIPVVLAACGNGKTDTEKPTASANTSQSTTVEPAKEVSFVYQGSIPQEEKDPVGAACIEYMKLHPNVKIKFQVMDSSTYPQKFPILVESNSLPDLFYANWPHAFDAVERAKAALDLAPYLDDSFLGLFSEEIQSFITTPNGMIAGFPEGVNISGMWCNKAIFDKYGLEIPVTIDDYKNCVSVLKKNGVVAIAAAAKETWATWVWQLMFYRLGIKELAKELTLDRTVKWSDRPIFEMFEFLQDMYDLGAFPENNSTMSFEQAVALFTSGGAAMIPLSGTRIGPLIGGAIEKDLVFTFGPEFPNSIYDQKVAHRCIVNLYGVGSRVANDKAKLDVLIDFNKWRYSQDGLKTSMANGYILPVEYNGDTSMYSNVFQQLFAANNNSNYKTRTSMSFIWQYNYLKLPKADGTFSDFTAESALLNNMFSDVSASITNGSLTAKQAAAKMDLLADDIIAKRK